MDILTLTPGGWAGGAGLDAYSLQFDLQDVYLVQGIVMMSEKHSLAIKAALQARLYNKSSISLFSRYRSSGGGELNL